MPRIIVTSDLHYSEEHVLLTNPKVIRTLVVEIRKRNPDAIVIAGDIGEPIEVRVVPSDYRRPGFTVIDIADGDPPAPHELVMSDRG